MAKLCPGKDQRGAKGLRWGFPGGLRRIGNDNGADTGYQADFEVDGLRENDSQPIDISRRTFASSLQHWTCNMRDQEANKAADGPGETVPVHLPLPSSSNILTDGSLLDQLAPWVGSGDARPHLSFPPESPKI